VIVLVSCHKQSVCWLLADRNAGHRVNTQPDMWNSSSDAVTNRHLADRLYEEIAARLWRAHIPPSYMLQKFPSSLGLYSKNRKELDVNDTSLSVLARLYSRITFLHGAWIALGNEPSGYTQGGKLLDYLERTASSWIWLCSKELVKLIR
jgi:hypothetical protein